jgi:DNA-binding SARP family transcriptional activator
MRIQILGPVRVWRDGEPLDPAPPAQRALLGLLALARGHPVSRTELGAGMWSGPPPPSGVNLLHTHVKRLRRLLEPDRRPYADSGVVRRVGDGYALAVAESTVDAARFRQRVGAARDLRREGRLDEAAEALGEALRLWQGPPLADVPALAGHPKVVTLANERLIALVRYGEVMVAAGRAAEGLAALEEAAAAQPLDEAGQAQLIRAYHAAGRRSLAFATYHEVRRRLVEDLGVDPGPELRAAHADLLGASPARSEAPATVTVPAPLPADVPRFAGRTGEIARLDALLEAGRPAPIAVVTGPAGVGKTSLALHWAHRRAGRFPDGQIYMNLRGFDRGGTALEPTEALRRLLDALGVPGELVPPDPDAQAALYRGWLATRRVLVVLDNARDAAQVRPLLPGGPSLLLVTSRNDLAGLVATDGAQSIRLSPLDGEEARDLLRGRLGSDRTAAEPQATGEILARCAGLPLALAIVAARAATRAGLPLRALADELCSADGRLTALSTGDPDTDLREVFSWSYRALSPPAARLFRLLGLHPGPDVSAAAAASLAGRPSAEVRRALAELVRASLAEERVAGRYGLHDLLQEYAADLAERVDSRPRRRAATGRLIAHYVHSGYVAERLISPARRGITLAAPPAGVAPERPTDPHSWFANEHAVLLAAVETAAAAGRDTEAWRLAWVLSTFLDLRGHWTDLLATQNVAVAAAHRAGDPAAEAIAHRLLARGYTRLTRVSDAHHHLQLALDLYRAAGDSGGQGETHLNLSLMWERQGSFPQSLDHARQALDHFATAGDDRGQARARNAIGWYHALGGEHRRALVHCRAALTQLEGFGDSIGQANTWDSLGYAHHGLGHLDRAVTCHNRAIELYRLVGDRHLEALALDRLGDTHRAAGDARSARDAWQQALTVLTDLDRPAADRVRVKLA